MTSAFKGVYKLKAGIVAKIPGRTNQQAPQEEIVAVVENRFTSLSPPTAEQSAELAQGLFVGSLPMPPPNFYQVGWEEYEIFYAEDDPDRTKLPWDPPNFVMRNDPLIQRAKTTVSELELPYQKGHNTTTFARVVHGVLDEEHCRDLIGAINAKGFTPALLNIGGGRQKLHPDVRDGFRVIVDSTPLASWLLEVVRPYLPEQMGRGELVELNNRCRFLCYTPGQEFAEHHDARYTAPSGDYSKVTVQIYLHDVPEEHGGGTTFFVSDGRGRTQALACQPELGSVLIFSQDLLHEGSLLKQGLKYTLRTEAMYRRIRS